MMTYQELETILRVANIYGFQIEEPFAAGRDSYVIRDWPAGSNDSEFYWSEDEGFEEFFTQLAAFFHGSGYSLARA
jgi:hypothetical protein